MSERLAQGLCLRTIDQLVERAKLREVNGEDGGVFRVLTNVRSGEPTGEMRVWEGDGPVKKVVYCGLWTDIPNVMSLDSHMVFAFTDPTSAVPHFTLDSVQRIDQDTYAFHLDLIPRVDLGVHLAYSDHVFGPVQASYDAGRGLEGLSEAHIGPRQRQAMSPWMLAFRADAEAYLKLDEHVNAYLDRFIDLGERGLPADVEASIADTDLAARDAANRAIIFSPQVDAVWDQIAPLIGDQAELNRVNLLTNDVITSV